MDFRDSKEIDLDDAEELKSGVAFKFTDPLSGRKLVAKRIVDYEDGDDAILVAEFKKMVRLSAEQNVGTVFYLARAKFNQDTFSCYVMDFIKGRNLRKILSDSELLSSDGAISLILQIARGLEYSHAFEVFHNDLHDENIIVDQFSILKLIDFLWWESKESPEVQHLRDLEAFKKIIVKIGDQTMETERKRLQPILDFCLSLENFSGASSSIDMLSNISGEICLMDSNSLTLLSSLVGGLKVASLSLRHAWALNDLPVPLEYTFPEEPSGAMIDLKGMKIENTLDRQFKNYLIELHRAGLCDSRVVVGKSSDTYFYSYQISFTSKLVAWSRLAAKFNFLPKPIEGTIHEAILKDPIHLKLPTN